MATRHTATGNVIFYVIAAAGVLLALHIALDIIHMRQGDYNFGMVDVANQHMA